MSFKDNNVDVETSQPLTNSNELENHGEGVNKRKFNENKRDKYNKKKFKGQNKNRGRTFLVTREMELCPRLIDRRAEGDDMCSLQDCKFLHDVKQYYKERLPSLGDECYVFNSRGHCPRGLTCRFGSKHVTDDGLNVVNEIHHCKWKSNPKVQTINSLNHDVQVSLRKHTYDFGRANNVLNKMKREDKNLNNTSLNGSCTENDAFAKEVVHGVDGKTVSSEIENVVDNTDEKEKTTSDKVGPVLDFDIIKLRPQERKKIAWKDKLYLSPLTTVGNLPFRRVCRELGADVTCGEMALATNLLQGKNSEWALTKRHGSEDLFGIQVCGSKPEVMAKCAQVVQEQADIDFVDINVGCPIDLIYRQGAGSGLLNKKKQLFSIVKSMRAVLDIPLTLKTRTGVYQGKNVALGFMADLASAGVDLVTVHGRTKEQRYTKLADWEYIEQCARAAVPTPVIGNGDVLSYEDYEMAKERSPTSTSIMIGRGALIKPWIFTEIKERRHWDISSQERFEMLRRYTNYGLEHWGTDTKGVETTRRFLLEWLSFLYRYVPVGLLDKPPQKMNERPPKVEYRDELELLMASPNCQDWIKISEMLLGSVPAGFQFLPKHKANSWA